MTAAWIVEAIDVFEDRHISLSAEVPRVSPDQFGLDRFEEGFNGGIKAISLAAYGYLQAMLAQYFLIVV